MKISAKIDYAAKAILELALHWPNKEPLQIGTIATRQDIPIKFLTQILINLKQLGYVESIRGKNGGYLLTVPPKQIKISDVVNNLGQASYSIAESQILNQSSIIDIIWAEIDDVVLKTMDKINFESIANRKRGRDKILNFEI